MKQTILKLILVSSVALPLGGIATNVTTDLQPRDTMSAQISDARRETQILTAFSKNPRLHPFDFSVSVNVGTVVLGGTVDDLTNKDLAERIAIHVDGIKFVVNHIVVDADYVPLQRATSESRVNERIQDAMTIASVSSQPLSDPTPCIDAHVDIISAAVPPETASARERTEQAVSDLWISSEVKSSLLLEHCLHNWKITIATLNGVVSLGGVVAGMPESKVAVRVAQQTAASTRLTPAT